MLDSVSSREYLYTWWALYRGSGEDTCIARVVCTECFFSEGCRGVELGEVKGIGESATEEEYRVGYAYISITSSEASKGLTPYGVIVIFQDSSDID